MRYLFILFANFVAQSALTPVAFAGETVDLLLQCAVQEECTDNKCHVLDNVYDYVKVNLKGKKIAYTDFYEPWAAAEITNDWIYSHHREFPFGVGSGFFHDSTVSIDRISGRFQSMRKQSNNITLTRTGTCKKITKNDHRF